MISVILILMINNSNLATKVDLKRELDALETRVNKKLDKIINTLDGFVGVVDDLRTDNVVVTEQFRDHDLPAIALPVRYPA